MFWAYVPSSETNRRGDGWMLVRTLTCARPGRSAGKVMVANRYLGNPTDRDDNGGLRNRLCYGSRTEAPREIEGIAIGPYRACAPQFYPNNLRLLRPELTDDFQHIFHDEEQMVGIARAGFKIEMRIEAL